MTVLSPDLQCAKKRGGCGAHVSSFEGTACTQHVISDRSRRKPDRRHQYYEGTPNGPPSTTTATSTGGFARAVGDHTVPCLTGWQRNNADGLMFAESDHPLLHVALQIPVLITAGLDIVDMNLDT